MVDAVPASVELALRDGRLSCPPCGGRLGPWGHARERGLRLRSGALSRLRPRRARCHACRRTHVLLPVIALLRRRDEVAVIGAALVARARGAGHRRVAERLGVPKDTVRGWLRRFAAVRVAIREHFTRWTFSLDPELGPIAPAAEGFADAVEAIAVAARAWVLRFGSVAVWPLVAALSGGGLLSTRVAPSRRCRDREGFAPVPRSARNRSEQERRDIGLFRYALIREAADPALSKAERGRLVRALAASEHVGPDGRLASVGRSTLDDWIRAWRAGGFEALVPQPRRVAPLTPPAVFETAEA